MSFQSEGLRFGPLDERAVHVCVDMQRLFAEDTEWKTPWMQRVLPNVEALVAAHPSRTIFTLFIPANHAGEGTGVWARYWKRWAAMTVEALGEDMIALLPDLARFAPPALVIDKRSLYSPWVCGDLDAELRKRCADTLIVSGGETDVCVLATVLGAIDRGYRVIVVSDALCSVSDETHDASMKVYAQRYGQQVETAETAEILDAWK